MSFISVTSVTCMLCVLLPQVRTASKLGGFKKFMVGDTLSAAALVPIASQLLRKVEEPGVGKGFVSSTKTPKELADKLFEAFFSKSGRVVLKDRDIPGIDALQSLAMNGDINDKKPQSSRRKYMNTAAQSLVIKQGNELKRKENQNQSEEQKGKRGCRWWYECEDSEELNTCVLHTFCEHTVLEGGESKSQRRAAAQKIRDTQIRKWLGITEIDEEVEKILERRHATDHSDYVVDNKLKKLTDRFEHIMDRYLGSTTDSMGLK